MPRTFLPLALALLLAVGGFGCKKAEKTQAEVQAEKVKVFREKQRKRTIETYQELIGKYPDSPFAKSATKRLQELGAPTSPAPKAK